MNAQLAYLETEVATACPPKLRLLLIEGALRLTRQSRSSAQNRTGHEIEHALRSLKRIILHLLASVDHEQHALADKIKSVYMYLFSAVVEMELSGDTQKLGEVEKVLHVEHETWQILTDRYLAEVACQQHTAPSTLTAHASPGNSTPQAQEIFCKSRAQLDCLA